ncbi:hypothetical protein BDF21DRAFT_403646 [Thamnidium elegans]|nr:hypothetical protein BDF21DRAFT_403646 [Thamnidium elegans]
MNLGKKYHKNSLNKCVKQGLLPRLKAFIISFSRDVSEIVFRAQLFVNYYIAHRSNQPENNDVPRCVLRQQFWYSICQMVNGKRVTQRASLLSDMLSLNITRTIVYAVAIKPESSQCLTEASRTLFMIIVTNRFARIIPNDPIILLHSKVTCPKILIEQRIPNGENNTLFGNIIRSDEFCVDFLFYRRTEPKQDNIISIPNYDLELRYFAFKEVESVYRPHFLDLGRKYVFTATVGLDFSQHQIQQLFQANHRKKRKRDEKRIIAIESEIPTSKSLDTSSSHIYADYMLNHLDTLFTFYGFQTAKSCFNFYQGKQRAPEYMINMLLDVTAKKDKWRSANFEEEDKNRVPLIVFWNGMFGKVLVKLKGLRCGVAVILWRCLKKRDLLVAPIDKFKCQRSEYVGL